ncbi:MAG TPA: hypothetical protein VJH22_06895 [Candidatus Nanoarchaeia archaeon]|nr:hypothetical protein [Candidatus Nanoarchaeia archaeon]
MADGLFSTKKPLPPPPQAGGTSEDLAVLARRLRLLEERYSRVENNLRNLEDHLNNTSRDFNRLLGKVKSDLATQNKSVEQMQERMLMFIKELELLAKKDDVEVIKKYLNYWEPMKFIQASQVEKVVKELLSEMGLIPRM